jgi:hypothetical protein
MSEDEAPKSQHPENAENQPGTEGDSEDSRDTPPGVPSDDDAALGDTDQHSSADA